MRRSSNCHDNACAERFLGLSRKSVSGDVSKQLGKPRKTICSTISNCFTILLPVMGITMTYLPRGFKITMVVAKPMSRKVGAYQLEVSLAHPGRR